MEPTTKPEVEAPVKSKRKVTLSLDVIIIVILLMVIGGMLFAWKPWNSTIDANARKITVSGEATTKAEPDEFQFNPYYERDTTEEVTALNNEIVAKLKTLGVKDEQIKNNASKYGSPEIYYSSPDGGAEKTTLNLTITVSDKEMAQKVQDYLLTTDPKGTITPYPSFSTAKQKELENKARDEAIADARTKAEQTAKGLGASIGKVIEVKEGSSNGYDCGAGGICPALDSGASLSAEEKSLSIQPGQDEFSYTVTVVFALK